MSRTDRGSLREKRRGPRPVLTQAALYRLAVPLALGVLGLVMVGLLLLAGGVLLGILPYPGR